VQDMRIFGNFVDDDVPITLYTTKEIWDNSVGDYIREQESIVKEAKLANPNTTFKELIMSHEFKSRPRRKIDRPDVVNGIDILDTNRRGFPLNDSDFTQAYNTVRAEFPERNIKVYSKFCRIDIDDEFVSPLKSNKLGLSTKYKNIFKESLDKIKEALESDILFEKEPRVVFIYSNFINDWILWNPVYINEKSLNSSDGKYKKPPNISYSANDGEKNINLVVRLCETKDIKGDDIVMFYGRNGYNYFDAKSFKSRYFLEDSKQI
jgi:hypothetical protein